MTQNIQLKSILQWRTAVVAGLIAGAVFLIVTTLYLGLRYGLSLWFVLRYLSSIVLGESVVPPPATFDPVTALVGLLVNFALAVIYALILAAIIHRWGLIVGIIGGALFGIALYYINLYTFTLFFPWFFALHSVPLLLSFALFGAVAGGVYELLDYGDQPFMPAETKAVRS